MRVLISLVCLGVFLIQAACSSDGGPKDAGLMNLSVMPGTLSPTFTPSTTMYTLNRPGFEDSVQVLATPVAPDTKLSLNGSPLAAGMPSAPIDLGNAMRVLDVMAMASDGTSLHYTIVVPPPGPSVYVKASNTGMSDNFGVSVSLSGDTLAVGASGESSNAIGVGGNQTDNSAGQSGAVYVFARAGTTWSQQAYLKASNTGALDNFGVSVSLSGDTLAVGANGESSNATGVGGNQPDNSAGQSGAVYIFTRAGTTWSQQAYLKASNTGANDQFGTSVSLSGETLAVGAPWEDSSATGIGGNQGDNSAVDSGAVYVFARAGATWSQQAYLKASNTGANDSFGNSVSLSGDVLAIGAYGKDSNATGVGGNQADNSASYSGAVYVFARAGTTWSQQAYLKASNTGAGDRFGDSVSLSGDLLAVGATDEASSATGSNGNQADNAATSSGAVYVFAHDGIGWSQQAYLKASNTGLGDQFGYSLSLSGDLLVVGAITESNSTTGVGSNQADNSAPGSGAAYVFQRTGTTWVQQTYVKASNTEGGDLFGFSVSLSGATLAVGASMEDSGATGINGGQTGNSVPFSGAVYIFQ